MRIRIKNAFSNLNLFHLSQYDIQLSKYLYYKEKNNF